MKRSFLSAGIGALALLAGCAGNVGTADESTGETSDELSTSADKFVTLRRDFRRCMAPLCGGYFATDANVGGAEVYVSGLDFGTSGLDWDALGSDTSELIIKGRLGRAEPQFKTRKLVISEAYRGLPGQTFPTTDAFYKTFKRSPQIQCFTAPCPNLQAQKLNYTAKTSFDRVDVTNALGNLVDGAWVAQQVAEHGALVAGKFVSGASFPGGREKVLSADQVFLRLPYDQAPCPMYKLMACPEGTVRTYTRSADRCLVPSECVKPGMCAMFLPTCDAGYTQTSYTAGKFACNAYACDPSFTVATPAE